MFVGHMYVASSFGLAMALLDVTAVNVATTAIQTGLSTGVRGLSWVIDGYTLAFASFLLFAGGLLKLTQDFFQIGCLGGLHQDQGSSIDLAAGPEGQNIDDAERGRHHVARQFFLEIGA